MAQVLIIASLYDFAIDCVIRHLAHRGVSYLRLNREQFSDLRMTLDPVERTLRVRGLGLDSFLTSDLGSIWFRAPVFQRDSHDGPLAVAERLARSQWGAFLRAMMVFDSARWMNHPVNTYRAESKPTQLLAATRSGFRIPETLVTNDVAAVRTRFGQCAIVKSLDTVYLREGDEVLFAFTSMLPTQQICDSNLHDAPVIAQRVLTEKLDLRVTVIDNSLWAYRITCDGAGIEGDWRLRKRAELQFEQVALAADAAQHCIDLCRMLCLPFAAIDLVETREGIFFIEVNPTGEWAWLPDAEKTAGLAIANWLWQGSESERAA